MIEISEEVATRILKEMRAIEFEASGMENDISDMAFDLYVYLEDVFGIIGSIGIKLDDEPSLQD